MKFSKILLWVRCFITIIIFFWNYFKPEKSWVTSDCPPEYCVWQESDCKCVYNALSDCYCELTDVIDCHLSCVTPTILPNRIKILILIPVAIIFGFLLSLIITYIIIYIVRTIKLRKLFWEKWEKKRYALVPFRNTHIENKLNKKRK